jgi:stage II sporulation protein D
VDGEKVVLEGSGYGHGVGMSQNGANEMAKEGYGWEEILGYFFKDVEYENS